MNDTRTGALQVLITYILWGSLPIFWKLLSEINSVYILSQRVIWSALFMVIFLLIKGHLPKTLSVFKNPKTVFYCFICGVLITLNWGVYIYAVTSGHVLDASLGYFIEPIVVAIIGVILFKEKLNKAETATFAFAIVGLAYMLVTSGTLPVLSLVIAISFGLYGACKKSTSLDASTSLFMETLCMTPFAIAFALWSERAGIGAIGTLSGWEFILLPACGDVTSIPLLLFNLGVKKIPFYLAGIIMYASPTIQFLTGIFFFHEAFDTNRAIAFLIIWIGISFTLIHQLLMLKKSAKNS